MLRPATPLSVTLFFAFVLLLISVISTPLVKGIKLASSGGVDFGVFGYCKGDKCSGVTVGYPTNTGNDDGDFSLPPSTRHSLSPLLIVHPIAALFTLVLLVLSLTAHLHSPSHSPRYLLALLILTLPALILSLLAFLVDVLMFLPHLLWPGWTVLAATILLASSGIITCAMRRTLVSRKARKKRIAENAEMNGENFYARQATDPPPLSGAATAPTVDSGPGADKLPDFATFDAAAKSDGPSSNDDRIPLNSRTPSNKSQHEGGMTQGLGVSVTDNRYGGPPPRMGPPGRGRGGFGGARDEYGNPLPPSAAFGPGPGGRRENPQNRGGPGFSGPGRGGYPPGGRGGYGGRGEGDREVRRRLIILAFPGDRRAGAHRMPESSLHTVGHMEGALPPGHQVQPVLAEDPRLAYQPPSGTDGGHHQVSPLDQDMAEDRPQARCPSKATMATLDARAPQGLLAGAAA
ncbi:MAG: regulator of ime2 [Thelocarpon impressellum]|nr:MAG: regulator of ime2 [Thelocarpon impressellum]